MHVLFGVVCRSASLLSQAQPFPAPGLLWALNKY